MKIDKKTFFCLILNIIILPLLGNADLIKLLHINLVVNLLNYLLPTLLILCLLNLMIKNKYKPKINIQLILSILYIICLFISFIFSITYQSYTFTNLFKFITFIFLINVLNFIDYDEYEDKINKSIIYLSIFICLFGITQYIFGFHLSMNGIEKYPGSLGRIKSTMFIATILDKYIAFNIIYVYYLLFKKKLNIYLLLTTLLLLTITLALTFSRTGLIITIINLIILFIYFFRNKKWLLLGTIPILVLTIYLIPGQKYVFSSIAKIGSDKLSNTVIAPIINPFIDIFIIDEEEIKEEIENNDSIELDPQITSNIDSSQLSRDYYGNIAKNIMFKYPLTGIGIGSYNYIYNEQNAADYIDSDLVTKNYLYPHNMYYQFGAETGIICLGLFISILFINCFYKKNIFSYLLFISVLISCWSESIFYIKDICYFIIIIMVLLNNTKKEV